MAASAAPLTVAVTGPTGTFGYGLMPLLQADDRIGGIVGIARRPFDPAEHGWAKMEYRRGDVRQPDALEKAFRDADIVVHLAFMITGSTGSRQTIRAINVEGTLNAFRAAAAAGAKRFVSACRPPARSDPTPYISDDCGGSRSSPMPVDDPAAVEVVGRDLDADLVAGQHADAEPPHLAGEVREQLMVVLELHAEQQVRQGLGDLAVDLELLLYRHRRLLLDCTGKPPADRWIHPF
jgi:NAD dependent epimerase/dehydratase family